MVKAVAPKRKRLSDLFQVGKLVEIDDGTEEPIEIYIRKPNPFEHEEALRDGNAARARVALRMRDPKCDERDILEADLDSLGNAEMIRNFLADEKRQGLLTQAYGVLLEEEKWSETNLIEATQENIDRWEAEELKEGDEEWEDFQRAKAVLEEFDKALSAKADELREELILKLRDVSDEENREAARKILIDRASGLLFFRDYRIGCLYYGTREPDDHGKRYFTSKMEIRELPLEVQTRLLQEYDILELSKDDAKNSPSADLSSPESALPEPQEMSESSGPQDAVA